MWVTELNLQIARKTITRKPKWMNIAVVNPLKEWLLETTEPGEGSYVGYKDKGSTKDALQTASRKTLFPFYRDWCIRRDYPIESHVNFTRKVIQASPYKIQAVRRSQGVYIKGLKLKDEMLSTDYLYGGTMMDGDVLEGQDTSKVEEIKVNEEL